MSPEVLYQRLTEIEVYLPQTHDKLLYTCLVALLIETMLETITKPFRIGSTRKVIPGSLNQM